MTPRRPLRVLSAALIFTFFVSSFFTVSAEEIVRKVRLRHGSSNELTRVIEGLYGGQVKMRTMNDLLFVRTSPQLMPEVLRLISDLDKRPSMLRIEVRTTSTAERESSGIGASGTVSRRRKTIRATVEDSESKDKGDADRAVQVLEGSPAFINAGGPGRGGGFYVTARTHGDTVTLALTQHENASARTQGLNTSVSGKIGRWIDVGGVDESANNQSSVILGRRSASHSSSARVYIRVTRN